MLQPAKLLFALMLALVLGPRSQAFAQAPRAGDAASGAALAMQLGPQHASLAAYLGHWDVDIALSIPGQPAQHSKGGADYSWVIKDRWLGCKITGTVMGQPFEEFTILGYDSYAKNAVEVSVQSIDNSMLLARGPAAAGDADVTAMFGELEEYTTGELHRPYKVVLRKLSADRHVTAIWGLDAGDAGTKKIEFTFTRAH